MFGLDDDILLELDGSLGWCRYGFFFGGGPSAVFCVGLVVDSGGGEGLRRDISIGDSVEFWIGRSLGYMGGDEFLNVFVWDTSRGPKQLVCFLLENGRRCRRR